MRKILISDIHGEYDMFIHLLKKIRFNPEKDQLILMGDYINRGYNTRNVLNFLIGMKKSYKQHIFLTGNHDYEFLRELNDIYYYNDINFFVEKYKTHSRLNTLINFFPSLSSLFQTSEFTLDDVYYIRDKMNTSYKRYKNFLENLYDFYEEKDFICVHTGLFSSENNWRKRSIWDMFKNDRNSIKENNALNKWIFFGHFPNKMLLPKDDIDTLYDPLYIDEKRMKIGIDGGAGGNCVGGNRKTQLNAVVLELSDKKPVSVSDIQYPEVNEDENGEKYFEYGISISDYNLKHYFVVKIME